MKTRLALLSEGVNGRKKHVRRTNWQVWVEMRPSVTTEATKFMFLLRGEIKP